MVVASLLFELEDSLVDSEFGVLRILPLFESVDFDQDFLDSGLDFSLVVLGLLFLLEQARAFFEFFEPLLVFTLFLVEVFKQAFQFALLSLQVKLNFVQILVSSVFDIMMDF